MTIQQASQQLLFQLFHIYEEREARNIADLVMEKITGWKRIDRVMNKEVPLSTVQSQLLSQYIPALMEHKPVQYIINEAWFCGMNFYVDERVLIPRPETEELVSWIVGDIGKEWADGSRHWAVGSQQSGVSGQSAVGSQQSGSPAAKALAGAAVGGGKAKMDQLSILDIGTGSGCIAVALKRKLPGARVYGCDVSEEALEVARKNATLHDTMIDFLECDFLDQEERKGLPVVDVIVSNPPYVPLLDMEGMDLNVVKFEPHLALFVQDHNPLAFYLAIAEFAQTHLARDGAIYVEIHEALGNSVVELFKEKGFSDIQLKRDLQEKERMVKAAAAGRIVKSE